MEPNENVFQILYTIAIYIISLASIIFLILQAKKRNPNLFNDIKNILYTYSFKTFLDMYKNSILMRAYLGILILYTLLVSFQEAILRFDSYLTIFAVTILTTIAAFIVVSFLISFLINVANSFTDYIYNSSLNNRLTFSVYTLVFISIALFILSEPKNYLLYACYISLLISHLIIVIQLVEISINPLESLGRVSSNHIKSSVVNISSIKLLGVNNCLKEIKKENLQKSKFKVLFIFFILLFLNLYFEVITVSNISPSAFNKDDYFSLFYYTLVTFSTVGYGDVLPQTSFGMVQASIIIFSCMFFLTIFIGNLLGISTNND